MGLSDLVSNIQIYVIFPFAVFVSSEGFGQNPENSKANSEVVALTLKKVTIDAVKSGTFLYFLFYKATSKPHK